MRCGEFPPPLLKGGGAAYGHDVADTNTCSDADKAGSTCKMNCPETHPIHHFAHYWQEIICLPSGYWNQPLYTYYTGYCQAPSCNYFDILPPANGWFSCSHEGYEGIEFENLICGIYKFIMQIWWTTFANFLELQDVAYKLKKSFSLKKSMNFLQ